MKWKKLPSLQFVIMDQMSLFSPVNSNDRSILVSFLFSSVFLLLLSHPEVFTVYWNLANWGRGVVAHDRSPCYDLLLLNKATWDIHGSPWLAVTLWIGGSTPFDHDLANAFRLPFCFKRNLSSRFVLAILVTLFSGGVWGGGPPPKHCYQKTLGGGLPPTRRLLAPSSNPQMHDNFPLFSFLMAHLLLHIYLHLFHIMHPKAVWPLTLYSTKNSSRGAISQYPFFLQKK